MKRFLPAALCLIVFTSAFKAQTTGASDLGKYVNLTNGVQVPWSALITAGYLNIAQFCGTTPLPDNQKCIQQTIDAAVAKGLNIVFVPPPTWPVCSSIVEPTKFVILGTGRGDPGGPNSVISACPSFNGNAPLPNNYVIQQQNGLTSRSVIFGSQLRDIGISTSNLPGVGGVYRWQPEEKTLLHNVIISNLGAGATGLYTFSGQGMGPDDLVEILAGPGANAHTIGAAFNGPMTYLGLWNSTINMDKGANGFQTNACLWYSGGPTLFLSDHAEHCIDGFQLGNSSPVRAPYQNGSVNGFHSIGLNAGPRSTNVVHVLTTKSTPAATANSQNYKFEDTTGSATNYIADDQFSYLGNSQDYFVGGYREPGASADFTRISFFAGDPWLLRNPITIRGYPLRITGRDGESGLSLWGSGSANSRAWGGVWAGASSDGAKFTAHGAAAAGMDIRDGSIYFYSNTGGLTKGLSFSPGNSLTISGSTVAFPAQKAKSGTNYACFDVNGNLVKSVRPCSGT